MKRGQSSIEFLLITVVLVSLAFYAFFTVLRETELNVALSTARQVCNSYATLNSKSFRSLNYTIVNNSVTITPIFYPPSLTGTDEELKNTILERIFCVLNQNIEPSNCTRSYNTDRTSIKFVLNYTVV
jgi:hypothetical protein